ncbi:hypothetical protein Q9K01_12695 [Qipengyuania sp. DY56-A-20]|uniref:Uncharacterized protein n=1 Tax=Qipengyuania benthica TaxID=3067651 RepID=A0ABT9HAY0_9SPHN|nr:hypothetical protein [Qipengyuania sp. DY56-A-20]MDF1835726.1 hypothetical protein [Alteraurantiacibacter sp. bin_em_oilr2.035]MDP4540485.1 hypothetical protein [Qipengyuania sp. DY56-A-20]
MARNSEEGCRDGSSFQTIVFAVPLRLVRYGTAIAVARAPEMAGGTALFDLILHRPTRPVQAYSDIVGREPEISRNSFSRFFFEIDAPDDFGVIRAKRRQGVLNASAWIFIIVRFGSIRHFPGLGFIGIPAPLPRRAPPIMVNKRIAQDASEPGVHLPVVLRFPGGPKDFDAEILKRILRFLGTAQSPLEVPHEFGAAFGQSLDDGVLAACRRGSG